MLDQSAVYDALFKLATRSGCEQALFGTSAKLAHEAFLCAPVGNAFPIVWFEVPLTGTPRFDLHVALSRESMRDGVRFFPGTEGDYDKLFDWFMTEETGGSGLAFAYDVSEGRINNPAVHVNVNKSPLNNMSRFFGLVADEGAAERYAGFANCLPKGWRVWYAGIHPGRPGVPVRVDCFVDDATKAAYASDVSLLEQDLYACGFTAIGPAFRDFVAPVLTSSFVLELQFDVMGDGTLGPTLGVSASLPFGAAPATRALFGDDEDVGKLMNTVEGLGLSDDRWRHIPDALFATLVKMNDEALGLYCMPTFVKLRMLSGKPLDAKVYLQAEAAVLA